jgi:hypothetical protein
MWLLTGGATSFDANTTRGTASSSFGIALPYPRGQCWRNWGHAQHECASGSDKGGGSIAGFGPQAGLPPIHSFTTANFTFGLTEPPTLVHLSFMIGTMASHQGVPPFNNIGKPPSTSSAMTQDLATTAPSPLHHVVAVDRHPGIWCNTWSPTSLGLFS